MIGEETEEIHVVFDSDRREFESSAPREGGKIVGEEKEEHKGGGEEGGRSQ